MTLRKGILIESTAALKDTVFENVKVFIVEHEDHGTIGFIVNNNSGKFLHQLEEFNQSIQVPLYDGGPVDREHLFFVHQRPDIISEGSAVIGDVFYAGNFGAAVRALNAGIISVDDVKIFIGYCGWDAGELEAETAEGSWTVSSISVQTISQLS